MLHCRRTLHWQNFVTFFSIGETQRNVCMLHWIKNLQKKVCLFVIMFAFKVCIYQIEIWMDLCLKYVFTVSCSFFIDRYECMKISLFYKILFSTMNKSQCNFRNQAISQKSICNSIKFDIHLILENAICIAWKVTNRISNSILRCDSNILCFSFEMNCIW